MQLKALARSSGQSATYAFEEETSLDMNLLRVNAMGELRERTTSDYSVTQKASRLFTDSVSDDDSGTSLRRHYKGFEANFEMMDNRGDSPEEFGNAVGRSPLVGSTLEIRGGVEDTEIIAAFADGSEPALLNDFPVQPLPGLDRIQGAVDCAGLLPDTTEPTSIGDSWEIKPSALGEVLSPGGDPPVYFGPIQNQLDPDFLAIFGSHSISRQVESLTGDVVGTLMGTEEVEGRTVAAIQLEYDVIVERDPEDWMHAQSAPFEMAKVGQGATNARHAFDLKGQGTLLWDVTNARMISVELDAQSSSDLTFDYEFTVAGFDASGDEHLKFSGRSTIKLEATYAD